MRKIIKIVFLFFTSFWIPLVTALDINHQRPFDNQFGQTFGEHQDGIQQDTGEQHQNDFGGQENEIQTIDEHQNEIQNGDEHQGEIQTIDADHQNEIQQSDGDQPDGGGGDVQHDAAQHDDNEGEGGDNYDYSHEEEEEESHYGIIIDSGSSGSRVYLYHWTSNHNIKEMGPSCKIGIPLTKYESNPDESHLEIAKCFNKEPFKQLQQLKRPDREKTVLHLGATAGMRMLYYRNVNAYRNILKSLKTYFTAMPYQMKRIEVISGGEEAYDAWIAVNHLHGYFKDPSNHPSVGVLDLGGASTQISFLNPNSKNKFGSYRISVFGKEYFVFGVSLLCFGMDMIKMRILAEILVENNYASESENPCGQGGDVVKVPKDVLFQVPCTLGETARDRLGLNVNLPRNAPTEFTFNGNYDLQKCQKYIDQVFRSDYAQKLKSKIPSLTGAFYAMSTYYHTAKALNLVPTNSKDQFTLAVKNNCNSQISSATDTNYKTHSKWICLNGLFIEKLLTYFGFTNDLWNKIQFVNNVNGNEVTWALGFMIKEMPN